MHNSFDAMHELVQGNLRRDGNGGAGSAGSADRDVAKAAIHMNDHNNINNNYNNNNY